MPDMLIRDLDSADIEALKRIAAANGRSLQSEANAIIRERIRSQPLSDAETAKRIKRSLTGAKFTDSAVSLRKDRRR
jgi:plasmid stability protein